jgi:hypothetical protein
VIVVYLERAQHVKGIGSERAQDRQAPRVTATATAPITAATSICVRRASVMAPGKR